MRALRTRATALNGLPLVRALPLLVALTLLDTGCGAGSAPPPFTGLAEVRSPAGPGSGQPRLAAGPDGRIYMSWLEPEPGGHALRFAALDPARARWFETGTVVRGRPFFVNWADFPSILPLPDGSLLAHWLERSGPGRYAYHVHIARSRDGGKSWGEERVLHADRSETEHGFVSLVPWGDDGAAAAVWLDGRDFAGRPEGERGEMALRYAVIGANGRVGPEHVLDARTCECCQTAAAATGDGLVVAYRDRSPGEVRDIAVIRLAAGRWTAPRPLHEDGWVIPACPVNGPAIAAEGRRVAVAWFTAAGDRPRVRVAFSDDAGARFGRPVTVDEGDPVGRVDLALLPDGSALVSWIERTSAGAALRARRVRPDGRADPATTVAASSAERASGFPQLARAGEHLVFAWTDTGSPPRVRVAMARLAGP